MKKLLLFGLMVVLSTLFVGAAVVDVTFDQSGKIIYDMPFSVVVKADVHSNKMAGYDLTVSSASGKISFEGASVVLAQDYFVIDSTFSGSKDNGKSYRLKVNPKGSTSLEAPSTTPIFTLSGLKFVGAGSGPGDVVVIVKSADDVKGIGVATVSKGLGGVDLTVSATDSAVLSPTFSSCTDGFVAYIDPSQTGISGGKAMEFCDKTLNPTGCADDCTYIRSTHKVNGQESLAKLKQCPLGTSCVLVALTARERLLAKLNAIFNLPTAVTEKSCFPYAGHPEAKAPTGFCISGGATDGSAEGLTDQVPAVLNALREFYAIK